MFFFFFTSVQSNELILYGHLKVTDKGFTYIIMNP